MRPSNDMLDGQFIIHTENFGIGHVTQVEAPVGVQAKFG